jgi:hypothetical protein
MSALVGEAAKYDTEFWGAQFFEEEEEDTIYKSEYEEESSADSDFDAPEPVEEEGETESQELPKTRKVVRRKPSRVATTEEGATPKTPRKRRPAKLAEITESSDQTSTQPQMPSPTAESDGDSAQPRKLRKSSRSLTLQRSAEREKRRIIEQEKASKKKRPRRQQQARQWTQQELLEEAKTTEQINLAALEQLLLLEEKQKAPLRKPKRLDGPRVAFASYSQGNFLRFYGMDGLPPPFNTCAPPCTSRFLPPISPSSSPSTKGTQSQPSLI